MNSVKLRQLTILLHLSIAAFLAPAFLLVAVSGGLYLIGQKGAQTSTTLTLPAGSVLDFKSPTLEGEVRDLLARANIDEEFEYIKNRGTLIQTRPTSQAYVEFKQGSDGCGFLVGLLAANYRRKTLIASALGFVVFFILAL